MSLSKSQNQSIAKLQKEAGSLTDEFLRVRRGSRASQIREDLPEAFEGNEKGSGATFQESTRRS